MFEIGVGILSYNRLYNITKCISSIRQYTNLHNIKLIISDESTDPEVKKWLHRQRDITVLDNKVRLGTPGNTNRIIEALQPHKYKIIMDDDVRVLKSGWEQVYPKAIKMTGLHHFTLRQDNIMAAWTNKPQLERINKLTIKRWQFGRSVPEWPQGAVIAYDKLAEQTVGYYDTNFAPYGMSHVDWSHRISLSGIQPPGFYDVIGSDKFFVIHKNKSASTTAEKNKWLTKSKKYWRQVKTDRNRIYVPKRLQ